MGDVLRQYEQRLETLRKAASAVPAVEEALYRGFEDWERQLVFKLAPRLAGEGCLVVAVAGGTNTGKSTVFNSLLGNSPGGILSPVSPYGAYTKHPVIAASTGRYDQALERGRLLPDGFIPVELNRSAPDAVTDPGQDGMVVFVGQTDALSDRMLLLDTPDIDSVIKENWELAKSIREAGDVLVAVLTGQKYADSVVVEFFKEALRSGRHIVPLMNMADDADRGFEVTRRQLDEFYGYVSGDNGARKTMGPAFTMPRLSRDRINKPPQPRCIDDEETALMGYIESLDAVGLKRRILSDSLNGFASRADEFLQRGEGFASALEGCIDELHAMAHEAAKRYDARPGREFLTVVYDFIQKNARGPDRVLSAVTAKVVQIPGWVFSKTRALFHRKVEAGMSEQDMDREQRFKIEEILNRLYGEYAQHGVSCFRQSIPEAAAHFSESLRKLDPAELAKTVAGETLRTEGYMAAYREYAYKDLESRWSERSFRWKVKFFYDLGLLGSWAGVLVLLWAKGWAPQLPLSEILASFGVPVVQHTVTHAALYLWGDKLSGLIDKWQNLQREALEGAIKRHLTIPALGSLTDIAGALDTDIAAMKELNAVCRRMD